MCVTGEGLCPIDLSEPASHVFRGRVGPEGKQLRSRSNLLQHGTVVLLTNSSLINYKVSTHSYLLYSCYYLFLFFQSR